MKRSTISCALAGLVLILQSAPASAEWLAIVGDATGTVSAVSLDANEAIPLGSMPKQDQLGWLAKPRDMDVVYGFWSNGGITRFDLATKSGELIDQRAFKYHHGDPLFSNDGRWLVLHASTPESAHAATHLVDTSNWTVVKSWDGYHFSRAFAQDSSGLYLFDKEGVLFYNVADGATTTFCEIPGARSAFQSIQMMAADDHLLLIGHDRIPDRAQWHNGCPYRVYRDRIEPIRRLAGIDGDPCPGNSAEGPYWFYDSSPTAVHIETGPRTWDTATENWSTFQVLYRLSPDAAKVRTWEWSDDELQKLLPEDVADSESGTVLTEIYVAPDKQHLVGIRDLGYRYPAYMMIGNAETGEWQHALRVTENGATEVVFWTRHD